MGEDRLDFHFTSNDLLFCRSSTLTPPTVYGGEGGPFFLFSIFFSEVPVDRYIRWVVFFSPVVFVRKLRLSTKSWFILACLSVLTTWVILTFLFRTSRGLRSSWVRGFYLLHLRRLIEGSDSVWEVYIWPIVWVWIFLLGSGRFQSLLRILDSSVRILGALPRNGSISLLC